MTSHQKALLTECLVILAATLAVVVGMMHLKDYVNRSEAMRAMGQLGRRVLAYRQEHGSLPGASFVDDIKGQLQGSVRMGNLHYRALWIGLDASGDTILAYSKKRHPSSFLRDGYVVLRLDGRVEWMAVQAFEVLLAGQQTPRETEQSKK